MIKIENIDVYGFEAAIRGMRNPMNSWDRSDSEFVPWDITDFEIGENDMDLMRRLFKGGTEHRKYLRYIDVTMDIVAPLYWWKEFDTYKIGTVANSCSTMHKIHAKRFTLDDFSHEHLIDDGITIIEKIIDALNDCRELYLNFDEFVNNGYIHHDLKTKKDVWWQMIQLLPSSYNQRRTVKFNYEVAVRLIEQRQNHKLDEWHDLVGTLLELPYMKEIMGIVKKEVI